LVSALKHACLKAGVSIQEGVGVASVQVENDRVHGVIMDDARTLNAHRVLLAAGAWTRSIKGITRRAVPHIRPIRGQMIALDMGTNPLCEHVIRAPDAYLVPKSDGRLIIGATMEEMGFDPRPTAGGLFELLRGAWETMPGVYDVPVLDTWVGFRPMTLNNLPVLGPSPHVDGLWFATGHGRNGILLTAITATQVARAMVGLAYDEAIESFFR
jgi:glycine oxidase